LSENNTPTLVVELHCPTPQNMKLLVQEVVNELASVSRSNNQLHALLIGDIAAGCVSVAGKAK